jgi:hypothetical protein
MGCGLAPGAQKSSQVSVVGGGSSWYAGDWFAGRDKELAHFVLCSLFFVLCSHPRDSGSPNSRPETRPYGSYQLTSEPAH